MAGSLAATFQRVDAPELGRRDPQPWARRHLFSVHATGPNEWEVSTWRAQHGTTPGAFYTCTLDYESMSPYFRIRAAIDGVLEGLRSPFSPAFSDPLERARLQSAIADRLLGISQLTGLTHDAPGEPARYAARGLARSLTEQDREDLIAGTQLLVRHDLISMFVHPRLYPTPSLAADLVDDDDGERQSTQKARGLAVGDMESLFQQFMGAVGTAGGGESPVVFAQTQGAQFLSADGGGQWLRLRDRVDEAARGDAQRFLGAMVACASRLDGLGRTLDLPHLPRHTADVVARDHAHDDSPEGYASPTTRMG
jgi:hypothetical protein